MKQTQIATFVKRIDFPNAGTSALVVGTAPIEIEVEKAEDQPLSAVVMESYGIDSVILTEHENLQILVEDFQQSEDSKWFYGEGKKALYDHLLKQLKKENKYFNKKPQKMNTNNMRWSNFCDDCIILVALGNVLFGTPILLLHPQTYEQQIASNTDAWMSGADGKLPTLISGIETRATI